MRDTGLPLLLLRYQWIALVLLLSFVATACGGDTPDEESLPQVDGPALVMFYTDN